MKKIILIFLLINTIGFLKAQGNLQFNRVLSEEFEFDTFDVNAYQFLNNAFSVPAGKVWKITWMVADKVNFTTGDPNYPTEGPSSTKIDYKKSSESYFVRLFAQDGITDTDVVLWLGEGNYDLGCNNQLENSHYVRFKITGIEFNVLP